MASQGDEGGNTQMRKLERKAEGSHPEAPNKLRPKDSVEEPSSTEDMEGVGEDDDKEITTKDLMKMMSMMTKKIDKVGSKVDKSMKLAKEAKQEAASEVKYDLVGAGGTRHEERTG